MLAWFTSDSDGWYTPREHETVDASGRGRLDDADAQLRRVRNERRRHVEDGVDPLQRRIDTRAVAQVTGNGLPRSQLAGPISLGRVVHQRPHVQALRHEGRNDQAGELPGRPDS
jgi:hypothetical protein